MYYVKLPTNRLVLAGEYAREALLRNARSVLRRGRRAGREGEHLSSID
jgi:hypothetical protein